MDREQVAAELTEATRAWFLSDSSRSPRSVRIRFGLYAPVPGGKGNEDLGLFSLGIDDKRAARLGVRGRHALFLAPRTVSVSVKDGNVTVSAGKVLDQNTTLPGHLETLFWQFDRRADMVHDDLPGLQAAELEFASRIDALQPAFRKRYFAVDLEKVRVPHNCDPWKEDFHSILASSATYRQPKAGAARGYYRKWSASARRRRLFAPGFLADDYLTHNVYELYLVRDLTYLKLNWDDGSGSLFQLNLKWGLSRRLGGGTVPLIHSQVPIFESGDPSRSPSEATFFFAEAGAKDWSEAADWHKADRAKRLTTPARVQPSLSTFQTPVDPVALLREETGGSLPAPGFASKSDDWDVFAEMVRTCFPERIYEIDASYNPPLVAVDYDQLYRNAIAAGAKDSSGSIRATIDAGKARLRKNVLILAQGYPIPGTTQRFIGQLRGHVFARDLKTGVVTSMRTSEFCRHFQVASISAEVYRNTQAMVPFCKLVVWGGLAAMVPVTLGTSAFRAMVVDELRGMTLEKAAKAVYARFKHQVIALVLNGILVLLPIGDDRFLRFARGSLRGLAAAPICNLIQNYAMLAEGPKVYRWFKLGMRGQAAVRKIQRVLHELRDKVDDAVSVNLLRAIEDLVQNARVGIALLLSALLLLEYKQVRPLFDELGKVTGASPPTEKDWNAARARTFETYLKNAPKQIREQAEAARERNRKQLQRLRNDATLVGSALLAGTAALGVLPMALLGLTSLVVLDVKENDAKGLALLKDSLWASLGHMAQSPEEAEKVGELLGTVIGAVLLDDAIFAKNTRLKKIADVPIAGGFFKLELGHGVTMPILRLLFHHYIQMYKNVRMAVKRDLGKLDRELEKVLARDTDRAASKQAYADFVSDPDRKFTVAKLRRVLARGDDLIAHVLEELASQPDLRLRIERVASSFKAAEPEVLHGLVHDPSRTFEDPEAYVFVMFSFLHLGITSLLEATATLHRKLDPSGAITIATLLEILGLQGSVKDAEAEFHTAELLR